MNRLVRGSVLLAVAVIAGACGGIDNEGSDKTDHLVSDPAIVFVSNVDSQPVFVEAVNNLGQQLEGNFAIDAVGAGLIAFIDTTYLPVTGREGNPTRVRLFVKAVDPNSFVSSSITVSANGESLVIPVSITPANLPGTFSTTTPNVGDTVTFTAAPPLKFSPSSTVTIGGVAAIVTGFAPDSSSISFLPAPGSTGNPEITGVRLNYLSSGVDLVATTGLTVQAVSNYTGTDASATAPTVEVPSVQGASTGFFDLGSWAGDCGGVPCQWYKFTVTTDGDYFVTSAWDNTSDLGFFILASDASTSIGGFDAHGNGDTAQPEEGTVTLTAGTYYLQVQNFAPFYPDPDPAWFQVTFTLQ